MTVCLVISLPKIPYIHRIYMVLADLSYKVFERSHVLGKFTQPQQEHPEWPHPVHHFAEKVFCFACKGVFVC